MITQCRGETKPLLHTLPIVTNNFEPQFQVAELRYGVQGEGQFCLCLIDAWKRQIRLKETSFPL